MFPRGRASRCTELDTRRAACVHCGTDTAASPGPGWRWVRPTDPVRLVMTPRGVDALLGSKVKPRGSASVSAVPKGRPVEASTDASMRSEILSHSRSRVVPAFGLEAHERPVCGRHADAAAAALDRDHLGRLEPAQQVLIRPLPLVGRRPTRRCRRRRACPGLRATRASSVPQRTGAWPETCRPETGVCSTAQTPVADRPRLISRRCRFAPPPCRTRRGPAHEQEVSRCCTPSP